MTEHVIIRKTYKFDERDDNCRELLDPNLIFQISTSSPRCSLPASEATNVAAAVVSDIHESLHQRAEMDKDCDQFNK